MEHLEATVAALASEPKEELGGIGPVGQVEAERLTALEARLNDTATSVESLAELQRRTTNLDTSLTQSMSNMTEALEQNSAELAAMRAQLDAANARIVELETGPPEPSPFDDLPSAEDVAAQTIASVPFDPVGLDAGVDHVEAPEAEPVDPGPAAEHADTTEHAVTTDNKAMPVTDVIGETIRDEVLSPRDESDWFMASYAKKHQKAAAEESVDDDAPEIDSEEEVGDAEPRKKRRFRR